ncbi:hypothetical protein GQ53DRAFT_850787 [Thozetella sp. PMI_491]|nr:hypothetical protein GQ53DRAFT_850787 [Thozetella sp. PMI_491]
MQITRLAFASQIALTTALIAEPDGGLVATQGALSFAYAYGYGFLSYGDLVRPVVNATPNVIYHSRDLSKGGPVGVTRPNSDTLYSTTFIDLSSSDLILAIPEIRDRYWIFPFYDPYGNNIANIGSITNNSAGNYLVRYDDTNPGVQYTGVRGAFKAYINLPTAYSLSFTRILVQHNEEDAARVHAIQDQFNLTERDRYSRPIAPPLNLSIWNDPNYRTGAAPLNLTAAQAALNLTAKLAEFNLPIVQYDRSWVNATLARAGIANGRWVQPNGTNLTAAVATADASNAALLSQPGFTLDFGNNWTAKDAKIIGVYNSFYQVRYSVAKGGYLALTKEQATYPVTPAVTLLGNQSLLLSFSARPRITSGGFWSLTAYGGDNYLIPNALDRYSLGDRSNLTFPDGRSLATGPDGLFQILMQAADVAPPSNWTNNWLPTTAGGGYLSYNLRWYGAEESMTNGSYVYPKATIIEALRT